MSQYVYFLLTLSYLSTIISEWAGVIPLVCHLASYKHDYELVGQVSLTKRISVGLFPKLGGLHGVAQLLKGGPGFLDAVSCKGWLTSKVWDVQWGSGFPCANGAASTMIMQYSLDNINEQSIEIMPDRLPEAKQPEPSTPSSCNGSKDYEQSATGSVVELEVKSSTTRSIPQSPPPSPASTRTQGHRRCQILHVLQFRQTNPEHSWVIKIESLTIS
jgi:hypothetical protein